MNLFKLQQKRMEKAQLESVEIGFYAVRGTLPQDKFDREVALQAVKESGSWDVIGQPWVVKGEYVFALAVQVLEVFTALDLAQEKVSERGEKADHESLTRVESVISLFGLQRPAANEDWRTMEI